MQWWRRVRHQLKSLFLRPLLWLGLHWPPLQTAVRWMHRRKKRLAFLLVVVVHLLGAYSSLQAIMEARTPQGATAWAVALNTFPFVAVPAYWIFGHSELEDYRYHGGEGHAAASVLETQVTAELRSRKLTTEATLFNPAILERLARMPMTGENDIQLLIDGEQTFDVMFSAIEQAKKYVLVEFYILRDDVLGRRFQQLLIEKAAAGVEVMVLFDQLGSHELPDRYLDELRDGGVRAFPFNPAFEDLREVRLNFRNHRKIVVVDGKEAFVGGINVGDEYVGDAGKLGFIRDTNLRISGPVTTCIQLVFAHDWYWVTEEVLEDLDWIPVASAEGNLRAACLPSGPADEFDSGAMYFLHMLNRAKKRAWIATPYFVPDEQMVTALQLAALRGVDVRVLIPERSDIPLVRYSSYSYLPDMEKAGVKVYRYQPGFLHQKVVLIDDSHAAIGSANFDNRSFRLNFEIMLLVASEEFAAKVEAMLERDIEHSRLASAADLTDSSYLFRVAVRVARLLAPIQ